MVSIVVSYLLLCSGDIHRLMSGKDGSCCLGTYTCVANNCMGSVTSSAALLGFEDTEHLDIEQRAIAPDLQTPDISDVNNKPFSLSTIQEERTSQMMSPDAANTEHTLRQHSLEQEEGDISQKSFEVCTKLNSGMLSSKPCFSEEHSFCDRESGPGGRVEPLYWKSRSYFIPLSNSRLVRERR